MNKLLIAVFLCLVGVLYAHDGHLEGQPESWLQWFGSFHFMMLHFPIALITMTAVSDGFFLWNKNPIYDDASRFMLIAAALLATPTAILGLMYSYTGIYEGLLAEFLWWHMWFGFATAVIVILVALLRIRYGATKLYYSILIFLLFLVTITSYLGGGMVFGPYHMVPPI